MPLTQTTAQKLINELVRNTEFAQPTALYVSLHSADPGENGANEITGYNGQRPLIIFLAPSGHQSASQATLDFINMPAAVVTHAGLWDAANGGSFWWGGALALQKVLDAGDIFRLPAGDVLAELA